MHDMHFTFSSQLEFEIDNKSFFLFWGVFSKVVSEYDQEIPQSQTADKLVAS